VLARLRVNAPYNLTLFDGTDAATAFVGPDRVLGVAAPVATNHQERVDWPDYAAAVRSVERYEALCALRDAGELLRPPLYTAVYQPHARTLEYRWPGQSWALSLDAFTVGARTVTLSGGGPG
jgi:hypothetical protein